MCYYSSISVGFKIIESRFGVKFIQHESYRPVYSASAFTFPLMPVITNEKPDEITLLHWGLVPFWVKDNETAIKVRSLALNARSETIFTRPMFRESIISKRCLVVVDGFFEWRHYNNKAYPYYIRLLGHEPFALAGNWDRWHDEETGNKLGTFSVITTEANELMAQVHNTKKRMPVILPRADEKRWLDDKLTRQEINSLLRPYDAEDMEAYPVSKAVNRLGFNTANPTVLEKQEYPELPPLN